MTNPDAAVEVCECGHEESDHDDDGFCNEHSWAGECVCREYKPRDDKYYADLADEARLERWESER